MRRLGSGALDLCYVATGRLDGCYEQGFSVWDVAAGMLIVEEAGGKITNCRGAGSNRKRAKGWWRATAYCTRICYAWPVGTIARVYGRSALLLRGF